jgi:hypothetical protein
MAKDVLAWVLAGFMKAIHVELANEAINVAMSEVLGQDLVLKLFNLFDRELTSACCPLNDGLILLIV